MQGEFARQAMRVLVYECITGGGWYSLPPEETPAGSLYREGQAMLTALASDLKQLPSLELTILRDARLPWQEPLDVDIRYVASQQEHRQQLDLAVQESDSLILIAPEFGGCLAALVRRVGELNADARLCSPGLPLVAWASDKQQTLDHWRAAGVPVPASIKLMQGDDPVRWLQAGFSAEEPLVLKPVDGAGSVGLQPYDRLPTREQLDEWWLRQEGWTREACLQQRVPGKAASVAAISDGSRWSLLPPCWQLLDPLSWTYLGGRLIQSDAYRQRAQRLAQRALESVSPTRGYVGLDLVLGPSDDGCDDCAIELNPRMTTSYVGLRHVVKENLAAILVGQQPLPAGDFALREDSALEFTADGRLLAGS